MRATTAPKPSAIILLAINVTTTQTMNHYPHIPANPLRRERLLDLAKFRRPASLAEAPSPIAESEAAHSPEETASGAEMDPEPGQ
jgi:hypothetical protein